MGGLEVGGRWVGMVIRVDGWVWCVGGLGGRGQLEGIGGMVCKWPCDISLERV